MIATIHYQIAAYEGVIKVECDPDDEEESIIAKAKHRLIRTTGSLPWGSQSWKVVNREAEKGDCYVL